MGFLKLFSKSRAVVGQLPSGSMTVDRSGKVVATTVSSGYPSAVLNEVADEVLALFREARAAQMPLTEFNLHFATLQITAREMRGGAMIFLSPKSSYQSSS
jgi:hypothetical protein